MKTLKMFIIKNKKWFILLAAAVVVFVAGRFIINGILTAPPIVVNPEVTGTPTPIAKPTEKPAEGENAESLIPQEGEEEEISPSLVPSEATPFPVPSVTEALTPEGEYYTISVKAEPEGSGTVTGAGTYGINEAFTLVATPNEGYVLDFWRVGEMELTLTETLSTYCVGDETYTAVFRDASTPDTFAIRVLASPPEGGIVKDAGEYEEGSDVLLEAIPNSGSR